MGYETGESMTICPNCKKEYTPELVRKSTTLLIQQEFPHAKSYQREQLISGICSDECWDDFLGVGEKGDEE